MNLEISNKIVELHHKDERLINIKEVAKIIGFNVDWVYKKIAKGEFPQPMKIGRSSRWSFLVVMEWLRDFKQAYSTQPNKR